MFGLLQFLHCQTRRQGLLQFLCLLLASDDQGVKVSAASNFKLHLVLIFLDLDRFGNLSLGCEQKVPDFLNFLRYGDEMCWEWAWTGTAGSNQEEDEKEGRSIILRFALLRLFSKCYRHA